MKNTAGVSFEMITTPHIAGMLSILVLVAFAAASAVSWPLSARSRRTQTQYSPDDGDFYVNFTPDYPTCANDVNLQDSVGDYASKTNVTVRPDCDVVIDYICAAVDAMAHRPPQNADMTSLTFSKSTCAGLILFPANKKLDTPIDYASCVSSFQSITKTCMLLDGSAGQNYASAGQQAGVMNIFHQFNNPSPGSRWQVSSAWGAMPGFMMGPPNYWGPVHASPAQNVARNGSIDYGGWHEELTGTWWHRM